MDGGGGVVLMMAGVCKTEGCRTGGYRTRGCWTPGRMDAKTSLEDRRMNLIIF